MRLTAGMLAGLFFSGLSLIVPAGAGTALAAPGDVLWEAVYSSRPDNDSDRAVGLAVDRQNNVIVTGSRVGRDGNYDYLTVKYGAYGSTGWVKAFDGSWYDVGRAVAVDRFGNVVVAGSSHDLENPKGVLSGAYFTDYRVLKYDPSGEPLFEAVAYGNRKDNDPASVATDMEGGIYVTGTARNAPDTYTLFYTAMFSPDGELLWEKYEDWGTESSATGIRPEPEGGIVVAGYFMDPVTGSYNVRILRYSPDGGRTTSDFSYNELYDDEKAYGLVVDGEGNIIVTGETSAFGGVTLTLKYGPGGELLWAAKYRWSQYRNQGNAVAVDGFGRVYVVGRTFREEQGGDFLLLVYDRDGTLLNDRTYSFSDEDVAEDVAVDALGNIVVTGSSRPSEQPAVFRTIRLEGFPAGYGSRVSPVGGLVVGGMKVLPKPAPASFALLAGHVPPLRYEDPLDELVSYGYSFYFLGHNSDRRWKGLSDFSKRRPWTLRPMPYSASPYLSDAHDK